VLRRRSGLRGDPPRERRHEDESGNPTPRNRLSHYEYLAAGCLNVNPRGVFLAGNKEADVRPGLPLRELLDGWTADLEVVLSEVLVALVEGDRSDFPVV
jgi:hypothetical protein